MADKIVQLQSKDGDNLFPISAGPISMQGATATEAGKAGSVPTPEAGDNMAFLKGDGTWARITEITSQITAQNGATWYASTFKVYKMGPMVWFTGNLQKVNASISADSNVVIGTGFPRPIDSEFYLLGGTSNAGARKFAFRIKSDGSLTISSADNVTTTANTSIWQLVSGMYLTKD